MEYITWLFGLRLRGQKLTGKPPKIEGPRTKLLSPSVANFHAILEEDRIDATVVSEQPRHDNHPPNLH